MTPKEKAIDLIDKMMLGSKDRLYLRLSKQCALIAIDEILSLMIKFHNRHIEDNSNEIIFWEEVKNEINLL
jgi:hypothetical protein